MFVWPCSFVEMLQHHHCDHHHHHHGHLTSTVLQTFQGWTAPQGQSFLHTGMGLCCGLQHEQHCVTVRESSTYGDLWWRIYCATASSELNSSVATCQSATPWLEYTPTSNSTLHNSFVSLSLGVSCFSSVCERTPQQLQYALPKT